MQAKHREQAEARRLRAEGRSLDEIAAALGVSKSSASVWVRDVPRPAATPQDRERRRLHMEEVCWAPLRARRALSHQAERAAARSAVGRLSDRELFLLGVGLYWSEGSKSKAWRTQSALVFINSDPDMIDVFLAWLRMLGVERRHLRFRVAIHESADVSAAERFWAGRVGADACFGSTTLKRHNPKTTRHNVGTGYHGCLTVYVRRSAWLLRRIEGAWCGIVGAATLPGADCGQSAVV
ncbi:hypothetical protein [Streptacidiphilus rugosus]|uniref:hypothetical protein n=1 Tax=Streptacidiphilus rugosus TaxID=405783 RepID=UPI00055F36EC|nr:hypothetical protein [Streptacidiphilus rugosus]